MSKKIILLAGPTASGKSRLAIQLAKKIKGQIINADSMQIYKEFSILSSRPCKQELKKAKHHLYGIVSVKKYFSAGDWLKRTKAKINNCLKNKKVPIITGGTGLYFNTITKDTITKDNIKPKVKKSETLINKNSGEINKVDLDLFTRLKLEIITAFNILILNLNYYVEYHPYHFFKIINSNLISSEIKDVSRTNYIFTLTLAREYKYQQFIVYYDIDLIKTNNNTNINNNTNVNNNINSNYKLVFNKIELRGVPVPKTVEFHKNSKVELDTTLETTKNNLEKEELNEINKYKEDNYYYKDQ